MEAIRCAPHEDVAITPAVVAASFAGGDMMNEVTTANCFQNEVDHGSIRPLRLRTHGSPPPTPAVAATVATGSEVSTVSDNSTSSCLPDGEQAIRHDLRHALFTLRTGIALLGQVREDPVEFAKIEQLLQHEIKTASNLIDRLLGRPDSASR